MILNVVLIILVGGIIYGLFRFLKWIYNLIFKGE